jgi:hypothetical protein
LKNIVLGVNKTPMIGGDGFMSDMKTASELTGADEYVESDDEMSESTVEVSSDVLRMLGLATLADTHGPAAAESRTIHLRDRDLKTHAGVAVCRLTNPVLTVTRMFTPGTGVPYLLISFRYDVTSLGYSAPQSITQKMEFWNADGGTIFQWGFDHQQQTLNCDDNARDESFIWRWGQDVDWFDLWRRCRWSHHHWTVETC